MTGGTSEEKAPNSSMELTDWLIVDRYRPVIHEQNKASAVKSQVKVRFIVQDTMRLKKSKHTSVKMAIKKRV